MESVLNPTSNMASASAECLCPPSRFRRLWLLTLTGVWGLWWGGLTLYAAVVVPIGTEMLGGTEQGFITQRVTEVLNGLALGLCVVWLLEYVQTRKKMLAISWIVYFIATLCLLYVHARLSAKLDVENRGVIEPFYQLHAVYLWLTTVQWIAGLSLPFIRVTTDHPH